MKKMIAAALLAGLASVAFAQSNQVDVANLFVLSDLTSGYPTTAAKGGLLSQKNSYNDTTVTYTYTSKLDDANTIKGGALVDFYLPIVSGTDTAYQAQWAAKIDPFVQYQGFGLDAKVSFPIITFSPTDQTNIASGLNAAGNYNPTKFGALNKSAAGKYPAKDNTVDLANYIKAIYKYSFEKTFWVSGGFETELELTPAVWLAAAVPQTSVAYGPAQLDVKFDFYNTYSDNQSSQFTQFYLEPKFTYDLGSVGVAGLKPYVTGRYSAVTSEAKYVNASKPWHDSRIQPGVAYSFSVKDVGTFGADASIRFNKIDYDSTQAFDAAGYGDLRLNLTYSVKF